MQGGQVQLEQLDMRLAFDMAKMARRGFSRASIDDTQQLIKKPRSKVWGDKKHGVDIPGRNNVKAAIERHLAILRQNHRARCLPSQTATANNLQTCWRCKGTGAPAPGWRRHSTPEPTPPLSETPTAPAGNNFRAQRSQFINLPAGYTYSPTSLPSAEFSLLMYLPRIASMIQILFQICWLMKEHPLISTLSAVW